MLTQFQTPPDEHVEVERMLRAITSPGPAYPKPRWEGGNIPIHQAVSVFEREVRRGEGTPIFHMGPRFVVVSNLAAFDPSLDRIGLPALRKYQSQKWWEESLIHELIHSTGLEHRLSRPIFHGWGEPSPFERCHEELVAELGAHLTRRRAGILDPELDEFSEQFLRTWILNYQEVQHSISYGPVGFLHQTYPCLDWVAMEAVRASDFLTRRLHQIPNPADLEPKNGPPKSATENGTRPRLI